MTWSILPEFPDFIEVLKFHFFGIHPGSLDFGMTWEEHKEYSTQIIIKRGAYIY